MLVPLLIIDFALCKLVSAILRSSRNKAKTKKSKKKKDSGGELSGGALDETNITM